MVSVGAEADLGHMKKLTSHWLTPVSSAYSRDCAENWSIVELLGSCQSYRSVVLLQVISKCVWDLLGSLRPPQVVQGPPAHVLQGREGTGEGSPQFQGNPLSARVDQIDTETFLF